MSDKIGAIFQNWPNVNKMIKAFKKEDRTLIKVIKFIPNIIKLIGAIFMDAIAIFSKKVLIFFGLRGNSNEEDSGISHETTVKKTNNFWADHKGKILLGLGILGVGGLGYYLRLPKVVPNPCNESFVRAQKAEMEFAYNSDAVIYVNRDRNSEILHENQNSDGTKSVLSSVCEIEQNVINPSEKKSTIGMKPLASIIGRIVQTILASNGTSSSEEIQRTYQEDLILEGDNLKWVRTI